MLGQVVGCDEGQYVRLEAFEVFVAEDFDRAVFDGSVHSLCLTVGPGMIAAGRPVLDPMLDADAIEEVRAEEATAGALAILGRSAKAMPLLARCGFCRGRRPVALVAGLFLRQPMPLEATVQGAPAMPNISGKTP
jgi:hypothetical protein